MLGDCCVLDGRSAHVPISVLVNRACVRQVRGRGPKRLTYDRAMDENPSVARRSTSRGSGSAATTSAAGSSAPRRSRFSLQPSTPASRSSTPPMSTDRATASASSARLSPAARTLVVATKFGMDMDGTNGDAPGGSRAYMRRAIDASLDRLGRDHVDLYYYHRPDGVTPLEETLGAMRELVVEGKVRWLGLSNVETAQLRAGGRVRGRRQQPGRCGAELLQPDPPRRRGGGPAASRASSGWLHPVLPARERAPDRQVPARRARARRRAAERAGRRAAQRRAARAGRGARGVRDRAWAHAARARNRRARLDRRDPVGDRRCDEARAGAGQRRRRQLAAHARRARRARSP